MESEASFRDNIRNLCGLFVSIKDVKLYLIHQTAREFLVSKAADLVTTNPTLPKIPTWRHSINTVDSNLVLARICIFYLTLEEFDSMVPQEGLEDELLLDFLLYAAKYWSAHFRQAKIRKLDDATLQSTLRLCDTNSILFRNLYDLDWRWRCRRCSPSTRLMVACCFGLELVVNLLIEHQYSDLDL